MTAVLKCPVAPTVAGWSVHPRGDYAQPATAGGGYIEVQDDSVFEIAYETDQSARSMGFDDFLLTKVPVEVIRDLLSRYDANVKLAAEISAGSVVAA